MPRHFVRIIVWKSAKITHVRNGGCPRVKEIEKQSQNGNGYKFQSHKQEHRHFPKSSMSFRNDIRLGEDNGSKACFLTYIFFIPDNKGIVDIHVFSLGVLSRTSNCLDQT